MAACVEPIILMEYTNRKLDTTVDINANAPKSYSNSDCVIICIEPSIQDMTPKNTALNNISQKVSAIDDNRCASVLFTPTIYDAQANPDSNTITTPATLFVPGMNEALLPTTLRQ